MTTPAAQTASPGPTLPWSQVWLYSLYLQLLAVKTVHRVDWVRAAASVLVLVILAIVIGVVCAVAIFLPVFREAMRGTF